MAEETASAVVAGSINRIHVPGECVTDEKNMFMSGHGTYIGQDEAVYASVPGLLEQVNKLLRVKPVKTQYLGEVGDVVVGRISEVQQKRWKVDVHARLDAVLLSSSLMLPSGELRIKSEEDEVMMRQYFQEGDLISAEVQSLFQDGSLSLQTRSVQFGKLTAGIFCRVPSYLIKRRKHHFHVLPCGANIIFGCNGYVWIAPPQTGGATGDETTAVQMQQPSQVSVEVRGVMARVRNCVCLLAEHCHLLYDTALMHAYNVSLQYETSELLSAAVAKSVSEQVRDLMKDEQ